MHFSNVVVLGLAAVALAAPASDPAGTLVARQRVSPERQRQIDEARRQGDLENNPQPPAGFREFLNRVGSGNRNNNNNNANDNGISPERQAEIDASRRQGDLENNPQPPGGRGRGALMARQRVSPERQAEIDEARRQGDLENNPQPPAGFGEFLQRIGAGNRNNNNNNNADAADDNANDNANDDGISPERQAEIDEARRQGDLENNPQPPAGFGEFLQRIGAGNRNNANANNNADDAAADDDAAAEDDAVAEDDAAADDNAADDDAADDNAADDAAAEDDAAADDEDDAANDDGISPERAAEIEESRRQGDLENNPQPPAGAREFFNRLRGGN